MQGMTKSLSELFAMLKTAEVEIKKEHNVLLVNKTMDFKKSGKSTKGPKGKKPKRDDKHASGPPKAPKMKSGVKCFYCNGNSHWKRNRPKYLEDKKAGKVVARDKGGAATRPGRTTLAHWRLEPPMSSIFALRCPA
jgi:hypothetical protein